MHIRQNMILMMITLSLFPSMVFAQELPVPKGRRLKEIVADKYPEGNVFIGGTTDWRKRYRGSGVLMQREFSCVTPENDFKHCVINCVPGAWKWERADAWIKECKKSNQVIRVHGPISPQCSKWAKEDKRTGKELEKSMTEFMTKLCKRYDKYEHVKWLDVVNEVVSTDGTWFGPKPGTDKWENPWPKIGYDETDPLKPPKYIKLAFEIATKHAPHTKLIINQHGNMEEPMWNKVKALVVYLRKQGLRVDGIGWQAHVDLGFEKKDDNIKKLDALIKWAHANKLSFHVTENNVWLRGKKKDYKAQAETFAAIVKTLLENRETGIVTWNVWNLSDKDAWSKVRHLKASLFFDDYSAKPAYYAIQKLLENPPTVTKGKKK